MHERVNILNVVPSVFKVKNKEPERGRWRHSVVLCCSLWAHLSQHLAYLSSIFVQSQQWKQKNVRNLFKVNNKDTRTVSLTTILYCLVVLVSLLTLNRFLYCSGVSIVEFEWSKFAEQINWLVSIWWQLWRLMS